MLMNAMRGPIHVIKCVSTPLVPTAVSVTMASDWVVIDRPAMVGCNV